MSQVRLSSCATQSMMFAYSFSLAVVASVTRSNILVHIVTKTLSCLLFVLASLVFVTSETASLLRWSFVTSFLGDVLLAFPPSPVGDLADKIGIVAFGVTHILLIGFFWRRLSVSSRPLCRVALMFVIMTLVAGVAITYGLRVYSPILQLDRVLFGLVLAYAIVVTGMMSMSIVISPFSVWRMLGGVLFAASDCLTSINVILVGRAPLDPTVDVVRRFSIPVYVTAQFCLVLSGYQ